MNYYCNFSLYKAIQCNREESNLYFLKSFGNLEYLTLQDVNLHETSFIGLDRLKRLDLFKCNFKEFDPHSFRHLPYLDVLVISQASDFNHVDLSQLVNLKWLRVDEVKSLDVIRYLSSNLVVLEIENFKGSQTIEDLVFVVKEYSKLKNFRINATNSSDQFTYKWLDDLTKLEALSLSNLSFSIKLSQSPTLHSRSFKISLKVKK